MPIGGGGYSGRGGIPCQVTIPLRSTIRHSSRRRTWGRNARPAALAVFSKRRRISGGFLNRQGRQPEAKALRSRSPKTLSEPPARTTPPATGAAVLSEAGRELLVTSTGPWGASLAAGRAAVEQGRFAEAEDHLTSAVRAAEAAPAADADMAGCLFSLGVAYYGQHKFDLAEPPLRIALDLGRRGLGPDHPALAVPLWWLAAVAVQLGQPQDALPFFRRAIHVQEKAGVKGRQNLAELLRQYAACLREQSFQAEAEQAARRRAAVMAHRAR